jgi:hypothetical protein
MHFQVGKRVGSLSTFQGTHQPNYISLRRFQQVFDCRNPPEKGAEVTGAGSIVDPIGAQR